MARALRLVGICFVYLRRLDDRIRKLCAKVVKTREAELDPVISELKSALHEHTVRLRKMTVDLHNAKPPLPDRRKT
jgi:hypothetical protein